ncbi:hypothetical protein [Rhodococcus koreensis]
MRLAGIPRAVLRVEYSLARIPLQLLEDLTAAHLDEQAPTRLAYEQFLIGCDRAAHLLGDKTRLHSPPTCAGTPPRSGSSSPASSTAPTTGGCSCWTGNGPGSTAGPAARTQTRRDRCERRRRGRCGDERRWSAHDVGGRRPYRQVEAIRGTGGLDGCVRPARYTSS